MSQELIKTMADGVATLTINRPGEKNMLSDELLSGLLETIVALDLDNSVRVVVLTGTGEEFFRGRPWKSS